MFLRQVDESEKYDNHVQSLRRTYIIACSMPRSVSSKNKIGRTSERPPQHKNQKLSSAQNLLLPRWSQKFTTSRTITVDPPTALRLRKSFFAPRSRLLRHLLPDPDVGHGTGPLPVGPGWESSEVRTRGTHVSNEPLEPHKKKEKNSRDPSRDPYPHPHVEASGTAPFPRSTRVTRVTRVTPRRQVSTKPRDSKASSGTATSRPRWYSSRVLITSWPLRRTFPESRSPEKGPYRTARLSLRFLFKGIRKETLPSLDFGGFQIRF